MTGTLLLICWNFRVLLFWLLLAVVHFFCHEAIQNCIYGVLAWVGEVHQRKWSEDVQMYRLARGFTLNQVAPVDCSFLLTKIEVFKTFIYIIKRNIASFITIPLDKLCSVTHRKYNKKKRGEATGTASWFALTEVTPPPCHPPVLFSSWCRRSHPPPLEEVSYLRWPPAPLPALQH